MKGPVVPRIPSSDSGSLRRRGALKKIGELPGGNCRSPEHDPPQHIVLENGIYEYTCPSCGRTTTFTVANPTW